MEYKQVVLLILSLLLFFLVAIFSAIFITKRMLLNNNYKLKLRYNLLVVNPIEYSIRLIDTLVNNNDQLDPLLNYLKISSNNIKIEINKLKRQIQELNQNLNTLRLKTIYLDQKRIRKNLDLLENEQKKLLDFSLNTNAYTNYCSNLSIEIFDLIGSFKDFFIASKINLYYPNIKELIEINEQINQNNSIINEQLNYINKQEMNKILVKQAICLKDWSRLIKEIFNSEKYYHVYDFFISILKNKINKNDHSYDTLLLSKKIRAYPQVEANFKKFINISDFHSANQLIINELREIDDLRNKITLNEKINNFFNKYSSKVDIIIHNYLQTLKENRLHEVYKKIVNEYKKSEKIQAIVKDNIKLINKINEIIESQGEKFNSKHGLQHKKIEEMKNLLIMMMQFKDNSYDLLSELKTVTNKYIRYTYILNELKIRIYYLIKFMKKFERNREISDEKFNKIYTLADQNDELYNELKKEQNITDFEALDNFINEVNTTIDTTMYLIRDKLYINEITKKLKMYTNRYMDNKNTDFFYEIDDLIKLNKQEAAVDKMIDFINQINQKNNYNKKSNRGNNAIS